MKVLAFICHVLKKKKYNPKNTELSRDDGWAAVKNVGGSALEKNLKNQLQFL